MKKVFSIFTAIALVFHFLVIGFADHTITIENQSLFSLSEILVCIKHEFSSKGFYCAEDFCSDGIQSVEPIMFRDPDGKDDSLIDKEQFCDIYLVKLKQEDKTLLEKTIKDVSELTFVQSVSRNYQIYGLGVPSVSNPNDTYYSNQYAIELTQLNRAWSLAKGNTSVLVGVLDSGLPNHSELQNKFNVGLGENFTNEHTTLDPSDPGFTEEELRDNVGHGTFVAGLIGAKTNNSAGIAGTLWSIQMVALKVLKYDPDNIAGSGDLGWLITAINYAKNNGIKILNCSAGYETIDMFELLFLNNAISNYTGLLICAAGNTGEYGGIPTLPARLSQNNIISVANSTSNDTLFYQSARSAVSVDLAAPGTDVYSTWNNNQYLIWGGTSFSAPLVTGVTALILSTDSSLSSTQIKNYILNSVDIVPALSGKVLTGGRLNAFHAVRMAMGYVMGDVDFDGIVTAADARLVLRCAVGIETFTEKQLVLADVDYSDDVNAEDARLVLNMAVS